MLDTVGTLFIAGYLGSMLWLVFRRARETLTTRDTLSMMLGWAGIQILALTAIDLGLVAPVVPNVLMFALSLAVLTTAWVLAPVLRRVAAETRLDALLALHVWRLGGFFFLLLYAEGRLSAPFAQVAAIGDIVTGALAAVLVFAIRRGWRVNRRSVVGWNLFGLTDLVAAVSLALASIPGTPFQIFGGPIFELAFARLPWMLIPALIIPVLIYVHIAIHMKLRTAHSELPELSHHGVNA